MAFLRIHCSVCGGTWEIYARDSWNDDRARQCPHCFSEIDRSIWKREILPAFGAVSDANAALFNAHSGQHEPLFHFDVVENRLYQR